MPKATLTHLALHAPDIDECIEFYSKYCGMHITHDRTDDGTRVVWLSEPGRDQELIIVIIAGGTIVKQPDNHYGHFGFAVESKEQVDALAATAKGDGCLRWPPRQEPYPIGYYCGIEDPAGNILEFSYGQPLGPVALQNNA